MYDLSIPSVTGDVNPDGCVEAEALDPAGEIRTRISAAKYDYLSLCKRVAAGLEPLSALSQEVAQLANRLMRLSEDMAKIGGSE